MRPPSANYPTARPQPQPRLSGDAASSTDSADYEFVASGLGGLIPWSLLFLEHHFQGEPAAFHWEVADLAEHGGRTAIAAPRGHAKSTVLTLADTLYRAACYREPYQLIVSDTTTQAEGHVGNIFQELLENDLLVATYPHLALPDVEHYKRQRVKRAARDFITVGGQRITGVGAGTSLRGLRHGQHRPTRVKVDDLENDELVRTAEQRAKLKSWFLKSLSNLFGANGGSLFVIGTILHHDSLLNWLVTDPALADVWERRTFKAIDPITDEVLWPSVWTREKLALKRHEIGGSAFSSEYLNEPVDANARRFDRAWFPLTTDLAPPNSIRVRRWDLAATENGGDWTTGVLMARTPAGKFVVEHVKRARLAPGGVERLIHSTAAEDGRAVRVRLPQDPGQAGKAQAQYLVGSLAGYDVSAEVETGDKDTRARPLAAQAEAGNVSVVLGEWTRDFLDELEAFPAGRHDDQVDASAGAFNELARRTAPVRRPQSLGFTGIS